MKEQITIFYNKDKKHINDYKVKIVLTQDLENYTIISYYMINNKLKEFKSNLKWTSKNLNIYLLQCIKSDFFDKIERQYIMEVDLND